MLRACRATFLVSLCRLKHNLFMDTPRVHHKDLLVRRLQVQMQTGSQGVIGVAMDQWVTPLADSQVGQTVVEDV